MIIVAVAQGKLGQRILEHVQRTAPPAWQVIGYHFVVALPPVIDDPEEFLPPDLPQGDLLLYLGQDRKLAELLPDMALACQVKGVVAGVENHAQFPSGLRNQVKVYLAKIGIDAVFPAPLCALTSTDSENTFIKEFAQYFGTPAVKVIFQDDEIVRATLIRGAPCGNTLFVAEQVLGAKSAELSEKARLLHRQYPCMAAASLDPELQCSLMGKASSLIQQALEQAVSENGQTLR
jgi:hypothetical protein